MGQDTARAIEQYRAGRRDEALALAEQALRGNPGDSGALNLAGAILYELGRLDEAEGALSRLVALDPLFVQARINLAVVRQTKGAGMEAAAQFRIVAALIPDQMEAHERLGSLLHGLGDNVGATRHLRHAARLAPEDPNRRVLLSVSLMSNGAFAEAAEILSGVLARHPGIASAAVFGVADEVRGQEIHAAVVPHEGIELDPDEVIGFVRDRIAAYKYPRVVHVVDALPLGSSGKVLKRALVEQFTPVS